ncbi:hypothetical protein M0O54_09360, partial [Acinetobacter lactucae]
IRDQRGQFYFAICKVKGVNFRMPLTTLTDEQQRAKCCGVFHGDIRDIPTEGTFILPRGEKVLDAPKATKVKSSTITVTVRDIDKTDSTSSEADELRQRISKAITRGTSKLVKR